MALSILASFAEIARKSEPEGGRRSCQRFFFGLDAHKHQSRASAPPEGDEDDSDSQKYSQVMVVAPGLARERGAMLHERRRGIVAGRRCGLRRKRR